MKNMAFEEFKKRVTDFWRSNMQSMGYELPNCCDCSTNHYNLYYVSFTRFNPRTRQCEYTLNIQYEQNINDGQTDIEVNEQFAELSNIPEEYGDMHEDKDDPEWSQPPMFIYGHYKTLGNALKSCLKGDSINLRPYKALYY